LPLLPLAGDNRPTSGKGGERSHDMNWYIVKNIWVCKVKLADGQRKTLSTGVRASKPDIKWTNELKSIKVEAESVLLKRISKEDMDVRRLPERSFDEVCAMYREHYPIDESRMNRIEREFSGRMMDEITPLDIRRFHNKIMATCQPTTWNRYRNVLNAIFNRAIEWDFCTKNPLAKTKPYPSRPVKRFLTGEHADALLREAKKESYYVYAFLFFALKTGRRVSEIVSVEWEDVDFGKEIIRYWIKKKKGAQEEHYRKPPKSVFQMLFKLRAENKDKPFPHFPRRAWRRLMDKVDKEHGLPDRRFHALRHRCATEMIENGATLYDVQYYLCHSSPATTQIYAHVSEKRDEKIATFLE